MKTFRACSLCLLTDDVSVHIYMSGQQLAPKLFFDFGIFFYVFFF